MLGRAIALCVIAAASAAAADPSDSDRRAANEHARRGVALYKLGHYEEAIKEFEDAYVYVASDALLYNLGQAHRQLDHCREALDYYRRFLEGSPDSPLAPKVRELVPQLERACAVKLARPTDVAAGAPAAASPEPAPPPAPPPISNPEPPASSPAPTAAPAAAVTTSTPVGTGTAWTVRGALGAGVLSSGGAAAAPVGPVVTVTRAVGDDYAIGARVGAGLFAGDPGATGSAIDLLAIGGKVFAHGELSFAAYGGAGVLVLSELPRALGAGERPVRGSIAMPEVAALASIDRPLDDAWTIGAGAELAVGPSPALRGGAAIAASFTIGVGYRR